MTATRHIPENKTQPDATVIRGAVGGWLLGLALVMIAALVLMPRPSLAQTVAPTPVAAETVKPIKLEMPIRCTPGADCWIVNYVDVDPGKGVRDYFCGRASYDGHKGTDIAIVDARRMRQGVDVYASAAGTVIGTRDEMRDIDFNLIGGPKAVAGKECGNGVLLKHEDGWTTQYCHMLKDSIRVARGDVVKSGQLLGQVGTSGLSEFPHVHLQVKLGDKIIDPFAGPKQSKECGVGKSTLWNTDTLLSFLYKPTAVYNAGFSSTTPNARIAREGLYGDEILMRSSPVLAIWADMFWVKPGDKLYFTITGPNGEAVMAHATTLNKRKARRFAYAGIRRKDGAWPKGSYTGEIRLIRPSSNEEFSVVRVINVN